jgi:hypothetical protein
VGTFQQACTPEWHSNLDRVVVVLSVVSASEHTEHLAALPSEREALLGDREPETWQVELKINSP